MLTICVTDKELHKIYKREKKEIRKPLNKRADKIFKSMWGGDYICIKFVTNMSQDSAFIITQCTMHQNTIKMEYIINICNILYNNLEDKNCVV